jgi:hypothetical protein
VGQEAVDAAARVVADLEHRVDAVASEVVDVPRLQARAGGQGIRRDVDRVPAVVVNDGDL